MADDPDPPRKFYDLKPREFDRANEARGGQEPGFHPAEPQLTAPNPDPGRIDIHELHRSASGPGPALPPRPPNSGVNDVQAMLQDNLRRENEAGLNHLSYRPKRPSKRRRDYVLLMSIFNACFGGLAIGALRSGNAVLFVYCVAGIGAFSAGLTWVMWFVMDDY